MILPSLVPLAIPRTEYWRAGPARWTRWSYIIPLLLLYLSHRGREPEHFARRSRIVLPKIPWLVNEREDRERGEFGTVTSPMRLASLRIVREGDGQTVLPRRPATPAAEGQIPQTKPKSTVQHFILSAGTETCPVSIVQPVDTGVGHSRLGMETKPLASCPCIQWMRDSGPVPRMPGGSSERTGQNIRQGDKIVVLLDEVI